MQENKKKIKKIKSRKSEKKNTTVKYCTVYISIIYIIVIIPIYKSFRIAIFSLCAIIWSSHKCLTLFNTHEKLCMSNHNYINEYEAEGC